MKKVLCLIVLWFMVFNVHAENHVVKKAREVGVKDCLKTIEKISNFIIKDANYGVNSVWNSKHPDKQAFSSMIEVNFGDGTMLASLNVTKTASGECYVEYEKIFTFNKTCLALAKETENSVYKGELGKEVAYLEVEGAAVYLFPAGSGCIFVKKEIIMDGKKM